MAIRLEGIPMTTAHLVGEDEILHFVQDDRSEGLCITAEGMGMTDAAVGTACTAVWSFWAPFAELIVSKT